MRTELERMSFIALVLSVVLVAPSAGTAAAATQKYEVVSPNGRNSLVVVVDSSQASAVRYEVRRDGKVWIGPSPIDAVLSEIGRLSDGARVAGSTQRQIDDKFELPWGKCRTVRDRGAARTLALTNRNDVAWELELRAYDDGVAFRYRILPKKSQATDGTAQFELAEETTEFALPSDFSALYAGYDNFTSSHETLYKSTPVGQIPTDKFLEYPLLVWKPGGDGAAALCEARLRNFAGMYLVRTPDEKSTALRIRLSPRPDDKKLCVVGAAPLESPWRVVLLADHAGQLVESTLLEQLNDPPQGDYSWAVPGKSTWQWWNGEGLPLGDPPKPSGLAYELHRKYIDFCAANNIAYHAIAGTDQSWFMQSGDGFMPQPDTDLVSPRPELRLPELLAYARERGVGIRLWVHWKPLSEHLEETFATYEKWGIKGLMVDFLDRNDQEMVDFCERVLQCAARHKLHIQFHGAYPPTGEQRTYPHNFNREGALNLEYLKWSADCTPAHNVDVAYTRNLAGPVDYHLGGFRALPRDKFQVRFVKPYVLGTRCHHLALYVVFENPMPMLCESPDTYAEQPGFDFLAFVPTTWDETRFVSGEPGQSIVVARRSGETWCIGGIIGGEKRSFDLPLRFLGAGDYSAEVWGDASLDGSDPNAIATRLQNVDSSTSLHVDVAPDGGFVAVIEPR